MQQRRDMILREEPYLMDPPRQSIHGLPFIHGLPPRAVD
jgi:hypothetical protein